MNTFLFWHDFPYFCMVVWNGDRQLECPLTLLHRLHFPYMPFKAQIKELRWIYSTETKKIKQSKNQDSKESRETRNHSIDMTKPIKCCIFSIWIWLANNEWTNSFVLKLSRKKICLEITFLELFSLNKLVIPFLELFFNGL